MCVLSRLPFFLRNFRGRKKGGKGRTRLFRRWPFLAAAAWPSARALKELGNLDHRWEEEKLVEDNNDNNDNKKVAPAPFPLPGSSGFSPALPSRRETKKVSLDCIQWVSNPRLSRDRCFRHPRLNCGASYRIDLKPAAIGLFRREEGVKKGNRTGPPLPSGGRRGPQPRQAPPGRGGRPRRRPPRRRGL